LVVSRMDGDTEGGYKSSKYQGQVQATGSKLYKDFQK
jgi:deoxycytidine triphosphate deaminase